MRVDRNVPDIESGVTVRRFDEVTCDINFRGINAKATEVGDVRTVARARQLNLRLYFPIFTAIVCFDRALHG